MSETDRDISGIRNPDQNFVDVREVKWLQESDSKFEETPNANQSPLTFVPSRAFSSEKAMAPHSSTLAWKIPWTEEPGRLQSMGSLRVGHH